MARSPFGRRFTLRQAAEYLDMTRDQLRALVRRRAITFHQPQTAFEQTKPCAAGQATRYVRGGNYFFYETELLAYLDATRREAASAIPAAASLPPGQSYADVSDLMPETRRFQ